MAGESTTVLLSVCYYYFLIKLLIAVNSVAMQNNCYEGEMQLRSTKG